MSVIRYTAIDRGKLIDGHSELTEYSFDFPITAFDSNSENKGSIQTSLSGKKYHTLHQIERTSAFTSVLLHRVEDAGIIASLEEFFSSVAAGETFEIDVYGTLASPGTFNNYTIRGSLSASVVDVTYLQYSFEVVEL